MDFPTYLREANQLGLTKDELLRVWETEVQIERIKVETRLLETKLRTRDITEVSRSGIEDKLGVYDGLMPAMQQLIQEVTFLREELNSQRQIQERSLETVLTTQLKFEELRKSLYIDFRCLQQEIQQNVQQVGQMMNEFADLKSFIKNQNELFFESMKNSIDYKISLFNNAIKSNVSVQTREEHTGDQLLPVSYSNVTTTEETGGRDMTRSHDTHTNGKETGWKPPTFLNGDSGNDEYKSVEQLRNKLNETTSKKRQIFHERSRQTNGYPKATITYGDESLNGFSRGLLEDKEAGGNDFWWALECVQNRRSADTEVVAPEVSIDCSAEQRWSKSRDGITSREPIRHHHSAGDTPGVVYIPATKAVIMIPNCGALADIENKDFCTDYLYTRPKTCRIRMRLWFNKRGHLGVQALVSEGVFDENHKWPLTFSGNGYIWNPESRKYTLVWTVMQQECDRPKQGEELPLGAAVALTTSRGTHNIVTHELLVKKHYIKNNRLKFRWDLKAEDVSTVPVTQNSMTLAVPVTLNSVTLGVDHDVNPLGYWSG